MERNLKLSLIIPVYNAENYIHRILSLLLKESYANIEVVCVNDGSKDASLGVLEDFARKDSRVKLIDQENSGAGVARNVGIENATGDILWFVDVDDEIVEGACAKIVAEFAKKPDLDLLIFNANELKNARVIKQYVNSKKIEKSLARRQNLSFYGGPVIWNKAFARDFVERNMLRYQNIKTCNDVAFSFLAMALAKEILYINDCLYSYCLGVSGAISRTRGESSLCIIDVIVYIKEKLIESGIYDSYKEEFFAFFTNAIRYEFTFSSQKSELLKLAKECLPEAFYKELCRGINRRRLKYKILSKITLGELRKKYKAKNDNMLK